MKTGIVSLGAYIPYYYIERSTLVQAWGGRGGKGHRAIANSDEDSITMALEAARDALRGVDRSAVTHMFAATTTSPYGEKSAATLISTAANLGRKTQSVDFNSSLRCGASALKLALDSARSAEDALICVTAADVRNAAPKSTEEQMFGDAAAAAVVGSGNVIAEELAYACVDNEIHDYWRNELENTVSTTEARFMLEEGYEASMPIAIKDAMAKAGVDSSMVSKLVVTTPDMKSHLKLAKKCGIAPEKVQDPLMTEVGCCGAAQILLILASAFETAQSGDIIVAAAYGSGASAFVFRVTDEIDKWRRSTVSKYYARRAEFSDYARLMSFRGLLVPKQGEPFKIPAAPSITWREQNTYLRLEAGVCTKCGCKTFPADRICYKCRSKDCCEHVSRTEAKSKLFSFSIDRLAGRSDDPIVVQACADDSEGIRFYMNMTDFEENEVKIGMDLEFTFRKIHNLANLPNYYWKFRPVRFDAEGEI